MKDVAVRLTDRIGIPAKFINDVNGTLYPLKQIPAGEDRLKGFIWMDKRRPKNKLELFE